MKLAAIVVGIWSTAGAAGAAPVAPGEWTSTVAATVTAGGQTKSLTSTMYNSEAVHGWREEAAGHPTVVTLFDAGADQMGMQMAVDQSNKCQEWCPPTSTYFNSIKVGDGKNGTSVATETGTNTWSWTDNLFVIAMDHKELQFASDTGATPLRLVEQFTPFGKSIGNGTSTYSEFKASADPAKFEVTGMKDCQQSPSCQQGLASMRMTGPMMRLVQEEFV
jgi:hypothetical protein